MAAVAAWVTAQAATSGTQATMASALLLLTHPAELPYLLRWTFQTGRRRPVFHTLIFTTPGKIALAICAAIILFALTQIMKLSKPIEYGGDSV